MPAKKSAFWITASDLELFAINTGSLYERHMELAAGTIADWIQHLQQQVLPLARREVWDWRKASILPSALEQCASALKAYYLERVMEAWRCPASEDTRYSSRGPWYLSGSRIFAFGKGPVLDAVRTNERTIGAERDDNVRVAWNCIQFTRKVAAMCLSTENEGAKVADPVGDTATMDELIGSARRTMQSLNWPNDREIQP